MATIYKPNGEMVEISPANGKTFTLEELQGIIGGWVQIISLEKDNLLMAVNENGKCQGLPLNRKATLLFYENGFSHSDYIVGGALVCRKSQIR